ncbi:helix-turn-helix domain-containing protein [Photobacterium lutimaris]|uniref:AraC family transcriptional regulator n=1 Tax=Photobacterium lutimaris TaxID=388278 RepID=A0A2T3J132_9GAMM|nr:AraC family transcriptional regulator [Photobacterium lutimaris]PSU34757.1 AraC family transcriptional regulator [Photobacterium lutimaris]TDR77080.1 AraC-like DNA-binding protein [Photobacterium lutimaris]
MAHTVRDINQRFWSSIHTPYLTIRSTSDSIQGYKAHSHEELSIGIIQSGMTCIAMGDKDILLQEGDIILIEPNKVHACNPVNGIARSYYMLYIDSAWCSKMLSTIYGYEVTQFTCHQSLISSQYSETALTALIERLYGQVSQQTVSEIEHALFHIVSCYCSPLAVRSNEDELAYELRSYLLENIAEPTSLSHIAQQLERPKESLIRSFKRRFGITPRSFVNNSRIEKAKLLLKNGMSIVDVANELGFSDQSQLHRAFVNYTASTPRQYQKGVLISDNNL